MSTNLKILCLDKIIEISRLCFVDGGEKTSTKKIKQIDNIFDRLPLPLAVVSKLKYRQRAEDEWTKKHGRIFSANESTAAVFRRYSKELEWYDDTNVDHESTMLKLLKVDSLDARTKFELVCIYCDAEQAAICWNSLKIDDHMHYLAERSGHCDPIVTFWTGICAHQPWLADSYMVRAFYWAAERNYVEALAYFWRIIERERADAVMFRAVRAFQLAAYHGHMQILTFLWSRTNVEQRRQMIQGSLKCSQGSLRALESACKFGRLDILEFLYNEAEFELRQLMLRADDCYAFRTVADDDQTEIVEFFLRKASRMKLCSVLLEADDCSSFRKATTNGRSKMVEMFWTYADDECRKSLMTAPFYLRRDLREAVRKGYSNVAKFLWDNSSSDLREILSSNFFAPFLSEESFPLSFDEFEPIKLIDEDA